MLNFKIRTAPEMPPEVRAKLQRADHINFSLFGAMTAVVVALALYVANQDPDQFCFIFDYPTLISLWPPTGSNIEVLTKFKPPQLPLCPLVFFPTAANLICIPFMILIFINEYKNGTYLVIREEDEIKIALGLFLMFVVFMLSVTPFSLFNIVPHERTGKAPGLDSSYTYVISILNFTIISTYLCVLMIYTISLRKHRWHRSANHGHKKS